MRKQLLEAIEKHTNHFKKKPQRIGVTISTEETIANILKAIAENKPYNEYNLLSKEEKIGFDNKELIF